MLAFTLVLFAAALLVLAVATVHGLRHIDDILEITDVEESAPAPPVARDAIG